LRYRLCLLKNSFFIQKAKILGIENAFGFEKIAYKAFLTQFYFCEFSKKEFFNRHA